MLVTYYKGLRRDVNTGRSCFEVITRELCEYAPDGILKCHGYIPYLDKGMPMIIDGSYNEDNKIFFIKEYSLNISNKTHFVLMMKYCTKELTDNQIDLFWEKSGGNLYEYISKTDENEIISLLKYNKNKEKVVKDIKKKIKQIQEINDYTKLFAKYDIPLDIIDVILKEKITKDKLLHNPYLLVKYNRIDIEKIDIIAKKECNIDDYDIKRLCGFILNCMNKWLGCGHTCIQFDMLLNYVNHQLKKYSDDECQINRIILNMCIKELYELISYQDFDDDVYVYFNEVRKEEDAVVNGLIRINSNKRNIPVKKSVEEVEKSLNIKYNRGQREAFEAVRTSGVKIITGPPGSGKTATIKGLIESSGLNTVLLSATTGMAAQVMSQSSGSPTCTVHKLLNITPYGRGLYSKDANNPIIADMIIVDEFSMAGLNLSALLFNAIQNNCILLLVGDEDQLESVDYGNVLHDLIDSGVVEVYRLTEIMRSSGTICENAQKVNLGETNLICDNTFNIHCFDKEEDIVNELLKYYSADGTQQILSPVKKGTIGTEGIHYLVEDKKQPVLVVYAKKEFRLGAKIVMTNNNYESGYINGDVGYIRGYDNQLLIIEFANKTLALSSNDFHDIEFADAITIHKSQGSEYKVTHIILPEYAKFMINKKLLYTAITRSKEQVHIYTIGGVIEHAIQNSERCIRVTMLSRLLKEKVKR